MTKTEKEYHVSQWQSSSLTKKAYCKEAGLIYTTFLGWTYHYLKSSASVSSSQSKFIPLEIASKSDPAPSLELIEVNFPNGIRVTCPINCDPKLLTTLISL